MSSSTDDLGSASLAAPALRVASPADAAALLRLKQRLDEETSFMLLELDERDPSAEHLARHLEDVARADNSVVIVAEVRSGLVGYVELIGGPVRRSRPTAQLVIGVLAAASGQGVGHARLFASGSAAWPFAGQPALPAGTTASDERITGE